MSADRRKTFLFNTEWANIARQFPPETQLAIYDGLIDYIATGEEPELSGAALMGFMFMRRELDEINAKYEARVAQNRENAAKGGAPKGNRNAKKKATTQAPETAQAKTTEAEEKQPNSTENNPIQPGTTEQNNPRKKRAKNSTIQPETPEIVEDVQVVEIEEKTTENFSSPQVIEIAEVIKTTENNPIQPKTNETTLYDNMIYGDLTINVKSYSVVVDAREVDFLEEFFSKKNTYQLDVLCMQEHVDAPTLLAAAQEVIAEWKLRGEEKTDYKDAARHLINHLRRKFEAARRRAREEAAAPKSRTQARADLIAAARNNMAAAIVNDGQPPRVDSAANDTKPF